jgi:iron-sulfur cluster assembly accessory protein
MSESNSSEVAGVADAIGGTPSLLENSPLSPDAESVKLTPEAVEAVKKVMAEEGEPGDSLRVSVIGGGCAGYQYDLNFDKEERIGDVVLEYGDVKVIIDPISAGYLKGTVIDYTTGLNGTGFKFVNPNAKRTCGCGSSWS